MKRGGAGKSCQKLCVSHGTVRTCCSLRAEGVSVPRGAAGCMARGEPPGGSRLFSQPQLLTRLIFISLRSRRANWVLSRCSTVRPCRRAARRCELLGFLLLCFSATMRHCPGATEGSWGPLLEWVAPPSRDTKPGWGWEPLLHVPPAADAPCSPSPSHSHGSPSFLSPGWLLPRLSVISLKEKRKSTTSPFSFLMGMMSSRHQNAAPGRGRGEEREGRRAPALPGTGLNPTRSPPQVPSTTHHPSCRSRPRSGTPACSPAPSRRAAGRPRWCQPRRGSGSCTSAASPRCGRSRSARRSRRSSRRWGSRGGAERWPG